MKEIKNIFLYHGLSIFKLKVLHTLTSPWPCLQMCLEGSECRGSHPEHGDDGADHRQAADPLREAGTGLQTVPKVSELQVVLIIENNIIMVTTFRVLRRLTTTPSSTPDRQPRPAITLHRYHCSLLQQGTEPLSSTER